MASLQQEPTGIFHVVGPAHQPQFDPHRLDWIGISRVDPPNRLILGFRWIRAPVELVLATTVSVGSGCRLFSFSGYCPTGRTASAPHMDRTKIAPWPDPENGISFSRMERGHNPLSLRGFHRRGFTHKRSP